MRMVRAQARRYWGSTAAQSREHERGFWQVSRLAISRRRWPEPRQQTAETLSKAPSQFIRWACAAPRARSSTAAAARIVSCV